MKVRDLMTRALVTVHPEDTLLRARELMLAHRVHHLPVVDGESRFVGLLTQHDLLARCPDAPVDGALREDLEASLAVADAMVTDLVAVDEATDLGEAGRYLLEHRIGCLPVLHEGHLAGIVTENDYVRLALELLAQRG